MSLRLRVAVLAAFVLSISTVDPALARDASPGEVSDIAAEAVTSEAARRQLGEITSIDGITVDMSALLVGPEAKVVARLRVMSGVASAAPGDWDSEGARTDAARILSDPRFGNLELKRSRSLFESAIDWLGDRVPLPVAGVLGSSTFLGLIGALMIAVIAVTVLRMGARRRVLVGQAVLERATETGRDPDLFDRRAEAAHQAGDFSAAVRLRFQAGMMRLGARGVLQHEQSVTAGALRQTVLDPVVVEVASTFEHVAYAGQPATEADAATARDGWRRILVAAEVRDG